MPIQQDVAIFQDFRNSVAQTLDKYENRAEERSLEADLSALWGVIGKHKHEPPTYTLFATLISEAFESEPVPFEEQWLNYKKPLFWELEGDGYIVKEYKDKQVVATRAVSDFEILMHTNLYQIADLHRMTPEMLQDPYRYFGVDSPTGNRWNNLDVHIYWGCAIIGMKAHTEQISSWRSPLLPRFLKCTWATLALLLELGQEYE